MTIQEYAAALVRDIDLKPAELAASAREFARAMEEGISGRPSSLKMLPSYLSGPTGKEAGRVLAVDFGGTNVRILLAVLDGAGGIQVLARERFPLRDKSKDFTSEEAHADELFGYIARKVALLAPGGVEYPLGHTFSFPCEQDGVNTARLIHWTKEIKTSGVEGQDVNGLLVRALKAAGAEHVRPVAVINDTVGTLLAAAYAHPNVDIASICGTGHNSCYLEPRHPLTGGPMIVNMESGNFDGLPRTEWDERLDQASDRPGSQKAEKMISGRYLGELLGTILDSMAGLGLLKHAAGPRSTICGADLDALIAEGGAGPEIARIMRDSLGLGDLGPSDIEAIRGIARAIGRRSARAVAAGFAGALMRIDPDMERPHAIAIDGSLYERMPGYDAQIRAALSDVLGRGAERIRTILAKDGSGLGAAIAAAIASGGN